MTEDNSSFMEEPRSPASYLANTDQCCKTVPSAVMTSWGHHLSIYPPTHLLGPSRWYLLGTKLHSRPC